MEEHYFVEEKIEVQNPRLTFLDECATHFLRGVKAGFNNLSYGA